MSSVAPLGATVIVCSNCPPGAAGVVLRVIVSFDSFRLSVPRVVLEPVSLLLTEPDLLSAVIVSALAFPLIVIVLLVFPGSSGLRFSFEGGDGNGFAALTGSLPFWAAGFAAALRLLGVADAVDRMDVDDGVFRNAVDFSGVVFTFGTGFGVPFGVCVDAFLTREVATDVVLASEGRLGLVLAEEGKAGVGAPGDRDVVLRPADVDVVESVEEVEILRDRPAIDSRAVLKADDVVDVSLRLDIDNVDEGRGEGGAGGRSVDWPVVPAAFLRIVDACDRTDDTDAAEDFGRCTVVTTIVSLPFSDAGARGARAPTPGRLDVADVPACAANSFEGPLLTMLSAKLPVSSVSTSIVDD